MYYVMSKEHVIDCLQSSGVPEPSQWRCPCRADGCEGVVFYGRHADGHVLFMATLTADPKNPLSHRIDNVEDFQAMMASDAVHPQDRRMFAMWLDLGLREVLLQSRRCHVGEN